YMQYRHIPPTF
nr:immunoglobulin light chain junction region [Macaca mulatta]MOX52460.1 immunoglobulin light chain junction region [Macaca mulatta]MOX52562.1 immunoglobulin light chain junction region [Macaca mulatta]MOX52595.1 immunoglobulin light chain junction region [Macaca mulatta]MOX52766.1 immunoglobulin light chain junction region [Macaca mulatta]